jgi:hypothetical protein
MSKLHKYYLIDECSDEDSLFETLESLQEDGKIEYELIDKDTLKIKDLDLTTVQERNLIKKLDELGLYPEDIEDDEDEDDLLFNDEDYEEYKPKKRSRNNEDDFDDF